VKNLLHKNVSICFDFAPEMCVRLPVNMHARAILNALACLSCAVSSALSTGAMKRFHASHYIKGLHEVVHHYRRAKECDTAKNNQVVAILMKTGLNNVVRTTLFTVVNILNNVGRTTLFNPQYC
jgi:hypothetical protein